MRLRRGTTFHLTADMVREVHLEALDRFGGLHGVRDTTLLEAAVAAPQATRAGIPAVVDLPGIAAAYLFYLVRNRPFVDANKRTALGACLVFLRLNGVDPLVNDDGWRTLTLAVADGTMGREEAAARVRTLIH